MAEFLASCAPDDLYRRGFRLYDASRPSAPAGENGRGAKGELSPAAICKLQRQ